MCASRKKLRLFCSCFPHHFFYCTSRPILCSAGFPERAGKCFNHCTCAKALGPSTSSAKMGWRRAGFFFSPATTCWHHGQAVCLCGAVTLLVGCVVERDAGVAAPFAQDMAWSSALWLLGHCRHAVAALPCRAISSFRKK